MASMVKTLVVSLALLVGGILVLKNVEARNTCPPGKYKNTAGVCACPAGYTEQNGQCKVVPKAPPKPVANPNPNDDDEEEEDECPSSAESACKAQNNAFGTNYNCELNDNCTCVCQRKANRAVVAVNRVMINDYYRNSMDTFDYGNKIYSFDPEEDYRYKAYPAFSDPDGDLYSFNPDGNTIPMNRTNEIADASRLKFANVVG